MAVQRSMLQRITVVLSVLACVATTGCKKREAPTGPAPVNVDSPFDDSREELDTSRMRAAPEAWTELTHLALGELFACGVASEQVYCWGSGRFGELGRGEEELQRLLPAGPLEGLRPVLELSANRGFVCALERGGTVSCWGNNVHGQLGDGSTVNRFQPVRVKGVTTAVQVTTGYQHACALNRDGSIVCWGENEAGQLGREGGGMFPEPQRVHGVGHAKMLAAGRATTCALLTNGRVECWGANSDGALGRGVPPEVLEGSARPGFVEKLANARDISGYAEHFCAATEEGYAYCWGDKTMPSARALRLRERRIAANLPVEPLPEIGVIQRVEGIDNVENVAVGMGFSCARQESGHVYCWGANKYAQHGSGSQNDRKDPTPMAGVIGAKLLVAGARNTCVLARDGRMLCSGANRNGEIGNGGTATALTPTPVQRPPQ